MRRLLIAGAVLLVLLFVGDRVAAAVAGHAVAVRLQSSEDLATRPTVKIRGVPFLTQAMSGHYDEMDVTAEGVHRAGVDATRVDAKLYGVSVGAGAALSGSVQQVPVERLTATVLV